MKTIAKKRTFAVKSSRKFAASDTFMCPDGEEIKILKVYHIGDKYASNDSQSYLIRSTDIGEDVWFEYHLLWRIEGAKKIR